MERGYYNSLNTDCKTELVWNYGKIVTTVETSESYISLFLLDNFYVEICVDKFKKELQYVDIQDDNDVLYEYIRDLDLDQMVN